MSQIEEIRECPHCGEAMNAWQDAITHPKGTDCIGAHVMFHRRDLQRWNRRVVSRAEQIKPLVVVAQAMSDMLAALEPILPTAKLVQSSVWARQLHRQALATLDAGGK